MREDSSGRHTWCTRAISGWRLWYQLAELDGAVVITEVRITPDEGPPRGTEAPASWSGELGSVPPGGLPARLLREIQTSAVITEAREDLLSMKARGVGARRRLLDMGFVAVARESVDRPGSRGHTDEFLAEVAAAYAGACEAGRTKPASVVAEAMAAQGAHYALDTVKSTLHPAKREGASRREVPRSSMHVAPMRTT
jgi:hypothetical protein